MFSRVFFFFFLSFQITLATYFSHQLAVKIQFYTLPQLPSKKRLETTDVHRSEPRHYLPKEFYLFSMFFALTCV